MSLTAPKLSYSSKSPQTIKEDQKIEYSKEFNLLKCSSFFDDLQINVSGTANVKEHKIMSKTPT